MSLERVLEPEVMDTEEEARDYDAMSHDVVNLRFCEDFIALARASNAMRVLDVGTGTALIPIEICKRAENVTVDAIDLGEHMLRAAEQNVRRHGLEARIRLHRMDAKRTPWPSGSFQAVISNSIVHHIPEPGEVMGEMVRLLGSGGLLFVRDLLRPKSKEEAENLVTIHSPPDNRPDNEPENGIDVERHRRQRNLFLASLYAALDLKEITSLVTQFQIPASAVQVTSDRHWTLAWRRP